MEKEIALRKEQHLNKLLNDIPDDVRTEWAVASSIYNYNYPSCYDPWGYKYNPLEIDSRYAGESVVRNVSNQMFNELSA